VRSFFFVISSYRSKAVFKIDWKSEEKGVEETGRTTWSIVFIETIRSLRWERMMAQRS